MQTDFSSDDARGVTCCVSSECGVRSLIYDKKMRAGIVPGPFAYYEFNCGSRELLCENRGV